MNLDNAFIIARKELKEITINRSALLSTLIFSIFFSLTNYSTMISSSIPGGPISIDWSIMYLALFVGVFAGFVLCGAVFYREKQSGVIETLLCTPLDLRSIWLGKVLGVAVPSYLFALLSVGSFTLLSVLSVSNVIAPSPLVILHLLVVVPLFTIAAIGVVGYIQLARGMRENRIISMVIFVLLFAGLSVSTGVVQEDNLLIGPVVLALMLGAALLFMVSFYLSQRLDKERIVRTIPD
jgi:ABC-2 type transport system permease protein